MQKSTVLTEYFARINPAPCGHYYLNILPKQNGDYTNFVGCLLDHIPTDEDEEEQIQEYIKQEKNLLLIQIEAYDNSDNVNSFYVNGKATWLSQQKRVGLKSSIQDEKTSGKTETTIYFDGVPHTLNVDTALNMLIQIEMYAKDCFIKTEEHKATVNAMTTAEEVDSFDLTSGYPEKLSFEINTI